MSRENDPRKPMKNSKSGMTSGTHYARKRKIFAMLLLLKTVTDILDV